jgi:hypothetical protein
VGDGDVVVEEFDSAEDESLAPCCDFPEDSQSIVSEDAEDKLIKAFGSRC